MTTRFPAGLLALGLGSALLAGCGGDVPPPPEQVPGERVLMPPLVETPPPELDPTAAPPRDSGALPPARPARDTATAPPPGAQEVRTEEGVIGVTGTDAWSLAVLRTDNRGSFGLTGDLEPELRRLAGIRVRVTGRSAPTAVGPGLAVTGYELLEVDGRTPHLGILDRDAEGGWVLRPEGDEDALALRGLPEGRLQPGMKIWVVGATGADGRLAVESYGIVAPAGG